MRAVIYGDATCGSGELGASCSEATDCKSGYCVNVNFSSVCVDGQLGSPCDDNADCAAGTCQNGTCQL